MILMRVCVGVVLLAAFVASTTFYRSPPHAALPLPTSTCDWQFCLWLVSLFDTSPISRISSGCKDLPANKKPAEMCISFRSLPVLAMTFRKLAAANNISIRPPNGQVLDQQWESVKSSLGLDTWRVGAREVVTRLTSIWMDSSETQAKLEQNDETSVHSNRGIASHLTKRNFPGNYLALQS